MKAFWWFKENEIAGMARPGFNHAHWFDVDFEEALILSWLGKRDTGSETLESFLRHIDTHGLAITPFYELSAEEFKPISLAFRSKQKIEDVLKRLNDKAKAVSDFEITDTSFRFELCNQRLSAEIEELKKSGINRIVCLTESHNNSELLGSHFLLHHLPINDLTAPTVDQVTELAKVISNAKRENETLAVHCMAGIGRTSTMLVAAHLALGESLENLKSKIAIRNPWYTFFGSQGVFIDEIAKKYRN